MQLKVIAKIYTGFPEKFGIPRQSGISKNLARIVFEPEYRRAEAMRGISDYSHLWLIWQFSEAVRDEWSPTVRPPRLGGNRRMGVFATRSPFRPNPIGLSSVRLIEVKETDSEGIVLIVEGADILDGTPIYDIKPYLAFTDSHPDAICGFADAVLDYEIEVGIPDGVKDKISPEDLPEIITILKNDPRPSYKGECDDREYGMKFLSYEIFFVCREGALTVTRVEKI